MKETVVEEGNNERRLVYSPVKTSCGVKETETTIALKIFVAQSCFSAIKFYNQKVHKKKQLMDEQEEVSSK